MPKPFEKGNKGKPKGAVNKLTKTFKELLTESIKDLQLDKKANLTSWAKENPTEFYKIAAKLIPTEVTANVTVDKPTLIIDWSEGNKDSSNA